MDTKNNPTKSAWSSGNTLIMEHGAQLPPNCVKCNHPIEKPIKPIKVRWQDNGIQILLLMLIFSKTANIYAGLCDHHKQLRFRSILFGIIGVIAGVACCVIGVMSVYPWLIVFGIIFLFTSLFCGYYLSRIVTPISITPEYIKLKGCGQEYLSNFPSFPM